MNFRLFILVAAALAIGIWIGHAVPTKAPPPSDTPSAEPTHAPGMVHLNSEKLQQARLRLVRVGDLVEHPVGYQATGSLTEDADLRVRVTSRLAATLTRLNAAVGDTVRQGQILAELESPELARLLSEYHEALTASTLARQALTRRSAMAALGDEVRRPLDDARNEEAKARADLKEAQAALEVADKHLRRTRMLEAGGVNSVAQVEQAVGDQRKAAAQAEQARTALSVAREHLKRESKVASRGLLYSKELQEAGAEATRAEERAKHLRKGLEILHADPDGDNSRLMVASPIAGVVVSRPVSRGESVAAGSELYTVVDTSRLWVWLNVYEADLSRLKLGQEMDMTVASYPNKQFRGKVSFISPELDDKTRTARARVVIPNPQRLLKPGMFVTVHLHLGVPREALYVPEAAVQKVDGQDVVYVATGTDQFVRTRVRLGGKSGSNVEVLEGLKQGQQVVAEGSFDLKAEDQKELLQGDD